MDSHSVVAALTCIWFMHSMADALMMEESDCMLPMRKWLVVSFLNMAVFRLCLNIGQRTSHAKDNFIFSLRHQTILPRLMITFIWGLLLPFSAVWTVLGTKWFYEAMCISPGCVSTGTQPWLVGVWQLLSYVWVSIYVFYFFIAGIIEFRLRTDEKNVRQIETEDMIQRWGHFSPAQVSAEPFFTSGGGLTGGSKAKEGLLPYEILALPDVEIYHDGAGMGNDVQCPICLSEFCPGDKIRPLPGCGHCFHQACVDLWLLRRADCPLCKAKVQ